MQEGHDAMIDDKQKPLAFDDRPLHSRRILFWAPERQTAFAAVAEMMAALVTGTRLLHPKEWVDPYVPLRKRQFVAQLLAAGEPFDPQFGHANCRICGVELGNKDMAGYGFIWPEKAEHYILEHDVWTPDCDALFAAARKN